MIEVTEVTKVTTFLLRESIWYSILWGDRTPVTPVTFVTFVLRYDRSYE